jgi:hypothetical protein
MLDATAGASIIALYRHMLLLLSDTQGSAPVVGAALLTADDEHAKVTTAVADAQHDQAVEGGVMHVCVVWYTCTYLAMPSTHWV